MFRIKICGVTNVDDGLAAADAGADAIGLNFYERSPRYISADEARSVADRLSGRAVTPVGVFVNMPTEELRRIFDRALLCAVQLHGDEPPDAVDVMEGEEARAVLVIRARRFGDDGVGSIERDAKLCRAHARGPLAYLVDAAVPGHYGGAGVTAPWEPLAGHRHWLGDTPLVLAGGLTPDNVAEAIRIVRPHAVDVASGVEAAPGKKDQAKIRDFVAAAKAAFESFPAASE